MCVCVHTTYSFTCNFNFAFVCSLSWLWRSCFTTFAPLRLHKKCMCHCCHMEFTLIGQHRHTHNRPHPIRIRPCSSSFIHNSLSCTTYQFEYMRVCMCAACLCIGNSRICHCFCCAITVAFGVTCCQSLWSNTADSAQRSRKALPTVYSAANATHASTSSHSTFCQPLQISCVCGGS